jgi:hypothetical protein
MKKYFILFLLSMTSGVMAQAGQGEKYPVYPGCEGKDSKETEACFYNKVQQFVFDNFKVPDSQKDFQGAVFVLFEVTDKGNFSVLYADANPDLITESKRVFGLLPRVTPPSYNSNPTYAKYTLKIDIPLQQPGTIAAPTKVKEPAYSNETFEKELTEFDSIKYKKFRNPQLSSHLNVPFFAQLLCTIRRSAQQSRR